MRAPLAALALLAALLAATRVEAGPWGLERGHAYVKLGYARLPSRTLANPDRSQVAIPRFVKQELSLYAAFGLGGGLTAFASVPAWRSSELERFERAAGPGDVQAGLQVQLWERGPWRLALRGAAQLPSGDATRASGLLPTGSGVVESHALLSLGRSLAGGRAFGFVELGPQWRETLRDGFVYTAQAGWNAAPRLTLTVTLEGLEPYDAAPRAVALGSPVGFGDRVAYLSYGPAALVKLGRGVGVEAGASRVARARNLAVGTTWRVGVYWSR
jgi:hypothetical protein